jgi:hypothetical protein
MMMNTEQIARIAHEVNRAYCEFLGDTSQVSWGTAPEWQKESAIQGVRVAQQGLTSEELHEAWCQHKREDGWVYGPVKDATAKTHPCLVPYDELPNDQKFKDHLFRAVVSACS